MFQRRSSHIAIAYLTGLLVIGLLTPAGGQEGQFFTGGEREEIAQEVERLAEIQGRYEERIMELPGVLGIGVGLDREKRQLAFLVVVETTAPMPDLPQEIEGVPVMVERHDRDVPLHGAPACVQPCHANQLPLPVEMGNSAFTTNVCSACTLGFVACDVESRQRVYVTNAHCSTDSKGCVAAAPIGTSTAHVGRLDANNCGIASIVGQTSGQVGPICAPGVRNVLDAAKVDSASNQTQFSIRDIGVPRGTPGTVLVGDTVQKSGRTTGLTRGTVAAVNFIDLVGPYDCCGNATFVNQIRVNALGAGPFIRGGDSGSALLNMDGEIVGLLFSGPADGSAGNANPIGAVLAGLGISLDMSKCDGGHEGDERPEFQYAAKFVCGKGDGRIVARGSYFTAINVHNPHLETARFRKKVAVALPGETPGTVFPFVHTSLDADEAFEIDCPDILRHSERDAGFLKGFVVVETDLELDIVAVYTVAGKRWLWPPTSMVKSIHTERVPPRVIATPAPEVFEPPDPEHCPPGGLGDRVGEEGCCCNKPRRSGGWWPDCAPGLVCVGNLPDLPNGLHTNTFSVCTRNPRRPIQLDSSQPAFCEQR